MIAFLMILALQGSPESTAAPPAVNFAHLDHLMERVVLGGDTVSIVHIYANFPDYHWVSAAESGPEGIACVDDAARAAVVCMRSYELRGDTVSLERARGLLAFVAHMQAPDGEMYNFVMDDHTINVGGRTSFKSFGWWAARGLWAMSMGGRVFIDRDPILARRLRGRVALMLPHVTALMKDYGEFRSVSGCRIPRWLLYESGADATSELILGLCEYRKSVSDTVVTGLITRLAEGLAAMQDGDEVKPPYGLHRSWETMWHMWGNGQTQALSTAGALLHDGPALASSEREARGWYGRLLMDGYMKELDVSGSSPPVRYEQIAYGVRPLSVGLVRLYEATLRREYLVMAGLAASWLTGNNTAGKPMYDPATGRCFDGIRDSLSINMNSGAESTIEALFTLLEVEHYPVAARYLSCRKIASGTGRRFSYALYRGPQGIEATLARDIATGRFIVYEGDQSRAFCRKEGIR